MSVIVAIHQPNYIPWLGYFYKIIKSNVFVILDNVQYVKGTVANRNYIKNRNGTPILLSVAVKMSEGWALNYNQIKIDYSQKWNFKHLNQIKDAYYKAPWFKYYFPIFEEILKTKYDTIAELNIRIIKYVINELNIKTQIKIASEIPKYMGEKNERNINIVKYFNGNVYLSGKGAAKYNEPEMFNKAGIQLIYSDFIHPQYKQINGNFIPNLSIIDVLMNCGAEETRKLIE
ncbi:MAG TPA: WbqC family protein [Bacteroidales bacterium]|nr:WbqC family protein [Bacteroidales bacterium]